MENTNWVVKFWRCAIVVKPDRVVVLLASNDKTTKILFNFASVKRLIIETIHHVEVFRWLKSNYFFGIYLETYC